MSELSLDHLLDWIPKARPVALTRVWDEDGKLVCDTLRGDDAQPYLDRFYDGDFDILGKMVHRPTDGEPYPDYGAAGRPPCR